jgi:hypothetical protein
MSRSYSSSPCRLHGGSGTALYARIHGPSAETVQHVKITGGGKQNRRRNKRKYSAKYKAFVSDLTPPHGK